MEIERTSFVGFVEKDKVRIAARILKDQPNTRVIQVSSVIKVKYCLDFANIPTSKHMPFPGC